MRVTKREKKRKIMNKREKERENEQEREREKETKRISFNKLLHFLSQGVHLTKRYYNHRRND